MKLQKYLGGVYHLYFEEVNIKFLVHKSLINESTRDMIILYMFTGITPEEVIVNQSDTVICFEPASQIDSVQDFRDNMDFLWFAL